MAWTGIERVTGWASRRKDLFLGVVGVAIDELAGCFPGGRLAIKLVGEVVKHGTGRLLDPAAEVEEVKASGQPLPANQLAELDGWLDRLTRVYGSLLDQLEMAAGTAGTGDATALVQRLLQDNAQLARSFDACRAEARTVTLSLGRIEAKLDEQVHAQNRLAISLEEYKGLLVDLPGFADYLQMPPEQRQAVQAANAAFRAGRREDGVAALLRLLQHQGVKSATVCHQLGMVYLGDGQVGEARRFLEKAGAGTGEGAAAATRTLLGVTAAGPPGAVAWRSLPRGQVIERRYRIEAEVGRGGMASVYRAVGVDLVNRGQVVALKVPAPGLMDHPSTRDRFLQEIQVSQRLSAGGHPGIVRTLNYVVFPDPHTGREVYGLVLEFIEGMSLARWLAVRKARGQPLSPREILAVLKPVCAALGFAHDQQPPVLHRDLKPHNVMLGRDGRSVKLMDFGIARVLDDRLARTTGDAPVGTPAYMAPEMCEPAGTLDARTDVYLAGNLLLELMTFSPTGDPESRPDCPAAWGDLVADAMSRLRSKRPASCKEFLDRLLAGEKPAVGGAPHPRGTLTVGREAGADHRSINEALRLAPAGGRIVVQSGVYRESLLLDRAIEVVGSGGREEVVVEGIAAACLTAAADGVVVRGLTFRCQPQAAADPLHALVVQRGNALIEDCAITSAVPHKGSACVLVSGSGAAPTFRNCRVHDGQRNGVVVTGAAGGVFEDCEIAAHVVAGVTVEGGANPVFRRCRIHGSKQSGGVVVWRQGRGTFEGCEVFDNASDGFRIREGSTPVLTACRVHDNRAGGVYVWDGARPTVERCEVCNNALAGVAVREGGGPVVRACHIQGNGGAAVYVSAASVRVESCDLRGNRQGAWDLRAGGEVQQADNRE